MPAKIYYDRDADLSLLEGKLIGVIGYGSQGRAQAQNLRDSGCKVIVGQRPGTSFERAVEDGFQPLSVAEVARQADLLAILLPDEVQADVFRNEIRPNLSPGKVIVCAHGFNVHFGLFDVPTGVATILVAPMGPGPMVRAEYVRGYGVPCLVAVRRVGTAHQDTTSCGGQCPPYEKSQPRSAPATEELKIALAYAKAIGGTRAGAIETTFAEETETDLFGEQAVLCGGLSALVKAGFETLVEAGYQPEIAYLECVRQVKLIADLIHQGGLAHMRQSISNTAEYGDYTRGPRIIGDQTKRAMREILAEIRDGRFAREWTEENRSALPPSTRCAPARPRIRWRRWKRDCGAT